MSGTITVAVPIYNGARYLASTIESILDQSHRDFTLLCIDDCSDDDSLAIAGSFNDSRIRITRNETRRGLAGNWNAAVAATRSPVLVIAHQDDVYHPRHLETVMDLLDRHPRAFAAHTRASYVDESGRPMETAASRFKDRFWPDGDPVERDPAIELRALQKGNYIICSSAAYRMSAVETIGPFNEAYRFVPDWEFWFRGLLGGRTLVGTHKRLVQWRRHDESATRHEEASLRRYAEELALMGWIADAAGFPLRLDAVENTLLSEFAARLARGDRYGAQALQDFVHTHMAGARRTRAIMRLGMAGGRNCGRALQFAESIYSRLARPAPR